MRWGDRQWYLVYVYAWEGRGLFVNGLLGRGWAGWIGRSFKSDKRGETLLFFASTELIVNGSSAFMSSAHSEGREGLAGGGKLAGFAFNSPIERARY